MMAIYARMCYCKPLHGVTVTDISGIQAKLALQYSALTDLYVLVVSQIFSRIGYAYLYTPFMCSALRRFPYLLRTNPPRAPPETPPKTSPGTGGALKATAPLLDIVSSLKNVSFLASLFMWYLKFLRQLCGI
jgi:hypothetical protein